MTRDRNALACATCGTGRFFTTPEPGVAPAADTVGTECPRCGRLDAFCGATLPDEPGPQSRSDFVFAYAIAMAIVSAGLTAVAGAGAAGFGPLARLAAGAKPADQLVNYLAMVVSILVVGYLLLRTPVPVPCAGSQISPSTTSRRGATLHPAWGGAASGVLLLISWAVATLVGQWAKRTAPAAAPTLVLYSLLAPAAVAVFILGIATTVRVNAVRPRFGQLINLALTWAGYVALLAVALRGVAVPLAALWRAFHPSTLASSPAAAPVATGATSPAAASSLGLGADVVLPTLYLGLLLALITGLWIGDRVGDLRTRWVARNAARVAAREVHATQGSVLAGDIRRDALPSGSPVDPAPPITLRREAISVDPQQHGGAPEHDVSHGA